MSQEDGSAANPDGQEPTEGQEPTQNKGESRTYDENYVKDLRKEAAAARKSRVELEARLKEYDDRDKSESDKLTERATAAEQRAADAEARITRLDIAEKKGLTPSQARRLIGDSEEELLQDADRLIADLGLSSQQGGSMDQGARRQARPQDFDSVIRSAAGR